MSVHKLPNFLMTFVLLLFSGEDVLSKVFGTSQSNATASEQVVFNTAGSLSTASNLHYLSIPAADFRLPGDNNISYDDYNYQNHGRYLIHYGGNIDPGIYQAPIHLPGGATIEQFTLHYRKNNSDDMRLRLKRFNFSTYINETVVTLNINHAGNLTNNYGYQLQTLNPGINVDNAYYAYYLEIGLAPSTNTIFNWLCGVTIGYEEGVNPYVLHQFSMPAVTFTPFEDGYNYINSGGSLRHYDVGGVAANGMYYGRVLLPNGARAAYMDIRYFAETLVPATITLQRTNKTSSWENMASRSTGTGNQGWTGQTETSIHNGVIDNLQYYYWVVITLPIYTIGQEVMIAGVVIGYEPSYATVIPNYVSIPAAAFIPYEDGYDFQNHGRYLMHSHSPGGLDEEGWYYAPLQLPHKSTLSLVVCTADFDNVYPDPFVLVEKTTLGTGDYLWVNAEEMVDNEKYAYWLMWVLPASTTETGGGCFVNYSYFSYLPIVRNE